MFIIGMRSYINYLRLANLQLAEQQNLISNENFLPVE